MKNCQEALLGVAVGDALGFPFEGRRREDLQKIDLSAFSSGAYPPGTWSDDTSLTFITAESLLACQGLDLEDLARRFGRWLWEGYFTPFGQAIGVGRATREALERYARGVPPERCGGTGERDNGNGGLMRILPVVLWYLEEEAPVFLEKIHQACSLTHAHPRSLLACGLYGLVIRKLNQGWGKKEALAKACQEGWAIYERTPFRSELAHFRRLLVLDKLSAKDIRASGYVVHSLEAVLWVFGRTNSYREAVSEAVRLGEDTDTTAAIVGGLAGFFYGGLPKEWLQGLVKLNELQATAGSFCQKIP